MPIDKERKTNMERAWNAYHGRFPDVLDYVRGSKQPNFNTKSNKCKAIVNIGRSYLFGKGPRFSVVKGAQAVQDDLDLVWKANHKGTLLRALYNNGAITGHAFLKIVPDGITYQGRTLPRLIALDSQNTYVEVASDDVNRVLAYNVEWIELDATGNKKTRRQRFERIDADRSTDPIGAPEQWQMRMQTRKTSTPLLDADPNAGWTDDDIAQWDQSWSPIEGCQHLVNEAEYYGLPSLTDDLIDLNVQLILARSSASKVGYLFGFPHRYGRGFEAKAIKFTPDGVPILPGDKPEIIMLSATVDLTALRDHAKDLAGDMDEMSQTPGVAMGRDEDVGGGKMPAATMELKFAPLLAKTDDQRELYGDLLASVNSHILELLGYDADMEVVNVWPQTLLPRDELQDAQAAAIWTNQGVSEETLMERAGFDPDVEQERKEEEQKAALQRMSDTQAVMGQFTQEDGSTAPDASGADSDGPGGQVGDSSSNTGKAATAKRPQRGKPPAGKGKAAA